MSYTVKKIIPFSKISKETFTAIQKLRKEKNSSLHFCYAYDSDSEFLFYFFLSFFFVFPTLFFVGNISFYEMSFIVLISFMYLGWYWGRHYRYKTEPCVFCDDYYIGYFSFRKLLLYNLIDEDGDSTVRKIDHVKSLDYEGLVVKFITGEQVKIYAQEGIGQYKHLLQTVQYSNQKSFLSTDSLSKSVKWYKDICLVDLIYIVALLYFLVKPQNFL